MSRILFLIFVFIVLAGIFFSVTYWLIGMGLERSIDITTSSVVGGLGALLITKYLEKRKKKKQESK